MSANFFSYAGNFRDMDTIGVDPRTGQFIVDIPLERLIGNNLLGPELLLKLSYNPLDSRNQGFGTGFSLGITQFNRQTSLLELSNGETWQVEPGTTNIRHHLSRNFRFVYTNHADDRDGYTIYWKDGRIEKLNTIDGQDTFVPISITTSLGFWLTLEWNQKKAFPLLERVKDRDRTLCEITYNSRERIISVWPGTDEEYQINFEFIAKKHQLGRVFCPFLNGNTLGWTFAYSKVSGRSVPLLTKVSHLAGMIEEVKYCSLRNGLCFPKDSGMKNLSVVKLYTRNPGNNQPITKINYKYSTRNFIGYQGSVFGEWLPGRDYIYKELVDYKYSSTQVVKKDGTTVRIFRQYNNYHLLIRETIVSKNPITGQDQKYQTNFTYHAKRRAFIDKQPAQFQCVQIKKQTWYDAGNKVDAQSKHTNFDEYGNILYEIAPIIDGEKSGRTTLTSWYAAEGEDDCPAEPNGNNFVRFMKEQIITPMETDFDAPVIRMHYTYQKLGDTNHVVMRKCSVYSGDVLMGEQTFNYNANVDSLHFGRILFIDDTKHEYGENSHSYTSYLDFSRFISDNILNEKVIRTGHDDIQSTSSYYRSILSGRILRRTDEQGIITDYTCDRQGRLLSRTDAVNSEYSNSVSWSYSMRDNGSVTAIVDGMGNQVKSYFDGAGQIIRQQKSNADKPAEWYDTFIAPSQSRSTDTTAIGTDSALFKSSANETEADGPEMAQTGAIITVSDKRSGKPLEIRCVDSFNKEMGTRYYRWDGLGRLREEVDELKNVTRYTYDAYSRLLTQTLPDGTVITRSYAPHLTGKQIASVSVTGLNGNGMEQTWHLGIRIFDSLGRLTWQRIGGRTTRYIYNGASPVPVRIIRPSGKSIKYSYIPELGNVIKSVDTNSISQNFNYDKENGTLVEAVEDIVHQQNHWSSSGRLLKQTFMMNASDGNVEYSWTQTGEMLSYKDIMTDESRYESNSDGQIIKIINKNLIISLEYDDNGRVSKRKETTSNNATLTTELTYDDLDRETSRTLSDELGNTWIITQTCYKNGLLASRELKQNGKILRREYYTYDRCNRLIIYDVNGSDLPSDAYGHDILGQTYRYDALNNIIQVITRLADNTTDQAMYFYKNGADPTQLTSVTHTHELYPSSITLQYDAEGRMICDQANRELAYDALGRLTSITQPRSRIITEYKYNAFNQLVGTVINNEKHDFYYRGSKRIAEIVRTDSTFGSKRCIEFDNTYLAVNDRGKLVLTGTDQNGNTILSRKDGQTETVLYDWVPYGKRSPSLYLPGFNGEWSDPDSGFYYLGNGYRAYNPVLMRFNGPDDFSPFGAGGINPYAYCNGDPINNIDPSGHMSQSAIFSIILGSIGLVATAAIAGLAITAAGGIVAALNLTSTSTLLIGGLGIFSDVTAIASGALDDIDPQTSSVLGWISLGLGVATLGAGVRALMRKNNAYSLMKSGELLENIPAKPITLGGTMRNVDILTDGLYTFIDTYKGTNRLNIVAHGEMIGRAGQMVVADLGGGLRNMDVDELFLLLKSNYDLVEYDNLRTIACYSGNGKELAFGARLSQMTGKPVKSYIDRVTANFAADDMWDLFKTAEIRGIYEGLRKDFSMQRTFQVYKTNPFKVYDMNRYTWSYKPVAFPSA